jgi:hypothetical protein
MEFQPLDNLSDHSERKSFILIYGSTSARVRQNNEDQNGDWFVNVRHQLHVLGIIERGMRYTHAHIKRCFQSRSHRHQNPQVFIEIPDHWLESRQSFSVNKVRKNWVNTRCSERSEHPSGMTHCMLPCLITPHFIGAGFFQFPKDG